MADMTTQTCDQLKEKNRLPTVTPEQLRTVNELRKILETDITPVQLAKFVVAEFGRQDPHGWGHTMQDNDHLMYPGRVAFEEEHDVDFEAIVRSIPAGSSQSRYSQPSALPIDYLPNYSSRQRETDERHFSRTQPNGRHYY
jgi:hypothetical protein